MSSDRAVSGPVRLNSRLVERPWGGEIWHTAERELPILVKFIYTHQALSIQVHPPDEYAGMHHGSRGKTEMWHIVSAAPHSRLTLGLRRPVSREVLRTSAQDGTIEGLLNQVTPRPGNTFFTPAGTVHAIGADLELWEIQQNSDITYRLYDYGSGRELHLEHALNVATLEAFDPTPVVLPVRCPHFETESLELSGMSEYRPDASRFHLLICMAGAGTISGRRFACREAWLAPPGAPFTIECAEPSRFLRVLEPAPF